MYLTIQNVAKDTKAHRPSKVWNPYGLNAKKKIVINMKNKKTVTKC